MFLPVDRSITVSAPQSVAQRSLSTSSSIDELTAELPMFALIFTRKLRPMIIGSSSGWLMLAGMIARPRATSAAHELGRQAFADRDELHLGRDVAAARVVELRRPPGLARAPDRPARGDRLGVAARSSIQSRAAAAGRRARRTARAARVVDAQRRLAARERDLAHRHADAVRAARRRPSRVGNARSKSRRSAVRTAVGIMADLRRVTGSRTRPRAGADCGGRSAIAPKVRPRP